MSETVTIPTRALTLAEWDALGDGEDVRNLELSEGMLTVTPRPLPQHQVAAANLVALLNELLPDDLQAVPDVDLVLEDDPPTVRAPDVVVVPTSAVAAGSRLRGRDAVLAVEFVSPGSRRSDRVTKLAEYAEAGIPNYWIIGLAATDDSRLTAFRLDQGSYATILQTPDSVCLDEPARIQFRLADLTARRRR